MIFIYDDNQTSTGATASSADSDYPITNLFEDYPQKVWKAVASTQSAIVRVPVLTAGSKLALINTNATTAELAMTIDSEEKALAAAAVVDNGGVPNTVNIPCTGHGYSAGNVVVIHGTTNYDGIHTLPTQTNGDADNIEIISAYTAEDVTADDTACIAYDRTDFALTYDRLWFPYTSQAVNHHVTMELTTTATTLEAGVVKAGQAVTLNDPGYPLNEKIIDHSITEELNSGSLYIKLRDLVRGFDIKILDTLTNFYSFRVMCQAKGMNPIATLLVENVDNYQWTCFGHIQKGISTKHVSPSLTELTFMFEEAI